MSDKNTELLNIASYCGNYKQEGNGYLCKCPCHDDTKPSLLPNLSPNNKIIAYCRAGCDWKTILDHFKSKGLMLDEQKKNTSKDIITDTYIYESSIGDVVFEKQRLEPEYMKDSGIKRFLYRRKLPNSNKYSYKDVIKSLPSTIPVPSTNYPASSKPPPSTYAKVKKMLKHSHNTSQTITPLPHVTTMARESGCHTTTPGSKVKP